MDKGKVSIPPTASNNSHLIKVTPKVNPTNIQSHPRSPSRPHSPSKSKPPPFMPAESSTRIKAKVSSSATIVVGRSSSSSNSDNSILKSTTRPPSPFKQPARVHTRKASSSRSAVDAQTSRPKASLAPHELSRQRSLTSTLEASLTGTWRIDRSYHPTPPSSPSAARLTSENASTSPAVRVKAKVSNVAKSHGLNISSTPASPSHPSSPSYPTRPTESRPRATSITDLSIFNPKPPLPTVSTVPVAVHPITTPTSAANPHRYAPRIPTNTASARFQSLSPLSNRDLNNGIHHIRVSSKVDPAAIPLPPQSPPTSTLSFSSQSSKDTQCSSVSGSTAPTPNPHIHVMTLTAASDVLVDICDPNSPQLSLGIPTAYTGQLEDSDRKTKAEAKTNRKIEDLEITNRSLLAINASLETTKHRQLTEIRDLRRKLRESRLMLPPPAYRTLKSSLNPEDMADDEDIDDDGNDGDGDGDDDEHDEAYKRIKGILEDLLETGRRALRAEPRDFEKQSSGVKVLSSEEVRSWRDNMGDDISSTHSAPTDAETDDEQHHLQRTLPTFSQSGAASEDDSEKAPCRHDDEKAVVLGGDDLKRNAMSLPPITVTFS